MGKLVGVHAEAMFFVWKEINVCAHYRGTDRVMGYVKFCCLANTANDAGMNFRAAKALYYQTDFQPVDFWSKRLTFKVKTHIEDPH